MIQLIPSQAGLFSAIIAAFIIESYKMLQQNSSDLSAQILAQISAKFDALSGNSSVSTSIPPVPSFVTPSSAVRVNALWFAGLISSLVTASLAMFVKQWLRQYLTWGCTSPAERIRIRYVRYEGLVRWKVFEIAAILPLLLQLALLLFLAGLSEFLRPLNFTVWLSTTVLAISWFVIYLNSVMAPAVSIICPYKTPLLINALNQVRGVLARLRYGMAWKERTGSKNKYYQFPGDERGVRRDTDFDVPAIISADKILADDATLVDIIRNCVDQTIGPETVTIAREILAHRLDGYPISFTDPSINFDRVPSRVLNVVVGALSNTIRKEFAAGRDIRWHPWLNEAFVGLCSLLNHIQSETRMVDMAEGVSVISGAFALPPRIVKNVLIVLATDSPWVTWKLTNQATSPAGK